MVWSDSREPTSPGPQPQALWIANRREFERRLQTLLGRRPTPYQHSDLLVHLDLEQFKVVNDAVGHMGGDRLLRQVSNVVQVSLRPSDTLVRLGGAEFGLILPAAPWALECAWRQ